MQTEQLDLGGIPALVWGPPGDGAVVAVHGNLSHKADTPIQLLAEAASARALQVLMHADSKWIRRTAACAVGGQMLYLVVIMAIWHPN